MTPETAERIAVALERIAEQLERLTIDAETLPETDAPVCLHPVSERMALGGTNGWTCTICQHLEAPS